MLEISGSGKYEIDFSTNLNKIPSQNDEKSSPADITRERITPDKLPEDLGLKDVSYP